jgi:hypothetical protein
MCTHIMHASLHCNTERVSGSISSHMLIRCTVKEGRSEMCTHIMHASLHCNTERVSGSRSRHMLIRCTVKEGRSGMCTHIMHASLHCNTERVSGSRSRHMLIGCIDYGPTKIVMFSLVVGSLLFLLVVTRHNKLVISSCWNREITSVSNGSSVLQAAVSNMLA